MSANLGHLFRLVWYDTDRDTKYAADHRHELLGDRDAIFAVWYVLVEKQGCKHVEVYSLDGRLMSAEKGLGGLVGYSV
jgi:hypothetical protein